MSDQPTPSPAVPAAPVHPPTPAIPEPGPVANPLSPVLKGEAAVIGDVSLMSMAARSNVTINVPAGKFYWPIGQSITSNGVNLVGAGKSLTTSVLQHSGSNSGAFVVHGDDFEASGIHFDTEIPGTSKTKINVFELFGARPNIHDCSASNVDAFVFAEATAIGAMIADCPGIDTTNRGDYIYVAGTPGIVIANCGGAGVWQEHWIRVELSTQGKNTATVLIHAGTYGNFDGKESIALRNALSVHIDDIDATANIRGGQVPPQGQPPVKLSVGQLAITNTRLHNRASLQLCEGLPDTTFQITADSYKGYCPVNVNGPNVHIVGTVHPIPMESGASTEVVLFKGLQAGDLVDVKAV